MSKHKNIFEFKFEFSIIIWHQVGVDSWNKNLLYFIIHSMATDGLVMQWARASATMLVA